MTLAPCNNFQVEQDPGLELLGNGGDIKAGKKKKRWNFQWVLISPIYTLIIRLC